MRLPRKSQPTVPTVQAAQSWLPVGNISGGLLFRPDGGVVGGVSIAPLSLALKSALEIKTIIDVVRGVINGLDVPWQIISVYRSVDLDSYLSTLSEQLRTADQRRRPLLNNYFHWVEEMVRGGEAIERRYYLLIVRNGKDAPYEHRHHLPALAQDLERARGLQCRIMTDDDWREVLFLTFYADQAAYERVPDGFPRIPPIVRIGG